MAMLVGALLPKVLFHRLLKALDGVKLPAASAFFCSSASMSNRRECAIIVFTNVVCDAPLPLLKSVRIPACSLRLTPGAGEIIECGSLTGASNATGAPPAGGTLTGAP